MSKDKDIKISKERGNGKTMTKKYTNKLHSNLSVRVKGHNGITPSHGSLNSRERYSYFFGETPISGKEPSFFENFRSFFAEKLCTRVLTVLFLITPSRTSTNAKKK